MAVVFRHMSWWLWSGKENKETKVSAGNQTNATSDLGLWESDTVAQQENMKTYSRRVKRKWHSREERKLDKEFDVVIVPSDGGCFSGSESDDDLDDSFAVLVPCYGHGRGDPKVDNLMDNFPGNIKNISDLYAHRDGSLSTTPFCYMTLDPDFPEAKNMRIWFDENKEMILQFGTPGQLPRMEANQVQLEDGTTQTTCLATDDTNTLRIEGKMWISDLQ